VPPIDPRLAALKGRTFLNWHTSRRALHGYKNDDAASRTAQQRSAWSKESGRTTWWFSPV
jgi:hypothetical protein